MLWALPVPGTATAAAPVMAMAIMAFVSIRIRCSPIVLLPPRGAFIGQCARHPAVPRAAGCTFAHVLSRIREFLNCSLNHLPITNLALVGAAGFPRLFHLRHAHFAHQLGGREHVVTEIFVELFRRHWQRVLADL